LQIGVVYLAVGYDAMIQQYTQGRDKGFAIRE
jgi:hypothetical protein